MKISQTPPGRTVRTVHTFGAQFGQSAIRYNNQSIRINDPELSRIFEGLKELRTPFSANKLRLIFSRLEKAKVEGKTYDLGADTEELACLQERHTRPGVYAEVTDLARFWQGDYAPAPRPDFPEGGEEVGGVFIKNLGPCSIVLTVYRVDLQGQTHLRALLGFNL